MAMPGFSSPRVSIQIRLALALASTFAVAPMVVDSIMPVVTAAPQSEIYRILVTELLLGGLIGLFGRAFFEGIRMMAGASAQMSSFNMAVPMVEEYQQLPPFAEMVSLSVMAMMFISNAHADVFAALMQSYVSVPVGSQYVPAAGIDQLTTKLLYATMLALRITSPFIVYGLIVNLSLGITNRLMPQMPVYFIGMPFVMAGGLYLLWKVITEVITLFFAGLDTWLQLI